jgi:hypothetical protein
MPIARSDIAESVPWGFAGQMVPVGRCRWRTVKKIQKPAMRAPARPVIIARPITIVTPTKWNATRPTPACWGRSAKRGRANQQINAPKPGVRLAPIAMPPEAAKRYLPASPTHNVVQAPIAPWINAVEPFDRAKPTTPARSVCFAARREVAPCAQPAYTTKNVTSITNARADGA